MYLPHPVHVAVVTVAHGRLESPMDRIGCFVAMGLWPKQYVAGTARLDFAGSEPAGGVGGLLCRTVAGSLRSGSRAVAPWLRRVMRANVLRGRLETARVRYGGGAEQPAVAGAHDGAVGTVRGKSRSRSFTTTQVSSCCRHRRGCQPGSPSPTEATGNGGRRQVPHKARSRARVT